MPRRRRHPLDRQVLGVAKAFPRPIRVGDLVRLPARIRNNPGGISPALREQAVALEDEIIREPGRVVSIEDDGWAMVDRGSWGQFGFPVDELALVEEGGTGA